MLTKTYITCMYACLYAAALKIIYACLWVFKLDKGGNSSISVLLLSLISGETSDISPQGEKKL